MKLLFVIPSLSLTGGVASHYAGLAPYWTVGISYSTYGKRKKIPAPLTLLPDIISYTFKIVFKKIDVVVVNPSLRKYQLFRDGIYILIALLFKKKVVTFIHGWDVSLSAKLENGISYSTVSMGKVLLSTFYPLHLRHRSHVWAYSAPFCKQRQK